MPRLALIILACAFALPAASQIPVKSYGQDLVDQVIARNPGLLVVVMHVSPPNASNYPIIASNIGRFGKPADEDDIRVVSTEKTNLEVARGGTRFEVELVLRDVAGSNIGALGLVFPYKAGESKSALENKAIAIRNWLATRILDAGNLVETNPYAPLATTKTHAQKLVDDTLARNHDVIVLAMHVTPPNTADNIIIASNFGRIGKKADAEDLKVIDAGNALTVVHDEGKRYGVELPLRDTAGKTIGALSVGFRHNIGDDDRGFIAKAERLRDELQKRIPSIESLIELDP